MAKVLTQRNIRRSTNLAQGTVSFHVTGGDTLAGADFQFLAEDGTTTLNFIPRRIDVITNSGAAAVTIDGNSYSSGSWNFQIFGGVPCGASIAVGAGNILIQLRS